MNVLEQKKLAASVIRSLEEFNSEFSCKAVVMGGAPRDWDNGVKVKDIDIFFSLDYKYLNNFSNKEDWQLRQKVVRKTVEDYFLTSSGIVLKNKDQVENKDGYDTQEQGIYSVWGAKIEGIEFDFIWKNKDQLTPSTFCASISKAWLDVDTLEVKSTLDYRLSHENKVIVKCGVQTNENIVNTYVKRLNKKYPDYQVINKEEAYSLFFEKGYQWQNL